MNLIQLLLDKVQRWGSYENCDTCTTRRSADVSIGEPSLKGRWLGRTESGGPRFPKDCTWPGPWSETAGMYLSRPGAHENVNVAHCYSFTLVTTPDVQQSHVQGITPKLQDVMAAARPKLCDPDSRYLEDLLTEYGVAQSV
jgi:hypothetical protein